MSRAGTSTIGVLLRRYLPILTWMGLQDLMQLYRSDRKHNRVGDPHPSPTMQREDSSRCLAAVRMERHPLGLDEAKRLEEVLT